MPAITATINTKATAPAPAKCFQFSLLKNEACPGAAYAADGAA